MTRTNLVFGDIEGKLDLLRVECTKCRKGRYHLHKLIERYGRKGNMMKWLTEAETRLPEAGGVPASWPLRLDMSYAEGALIMLRAARVSHRTARAGGITCRGKFLLGRFTNAAALAATGPTPPQLPGGPPRSPDFSF